MYEHAKLALDFIAIACIWAGCLVLYRRLRAPLKPDPPGVCFRLDRSFYRRGMGARIAQ
jgi:hypothetical protein